MDVVTMPPKPKCKLFGPKLDDAITRSGMTKTEVARTLRMSGSAVTHLAQGTQRPFLDQAWGLSQILCVPLEYLADDEQEVGAHGGPRPEPIHLSPEESALLALARVFPGGPAGLLSHLMHLPKRQDGGD